MSSLVVRDVASAAAPLPSSLSPSSKPPSPLEGRGYNRRKKGHLHSHSADHKTFLSFVPWTAKADTTSERCVGNETYSNMLCLIQMFYFRERGLPCRGACGEGKMIHGKMMRLKRRLKLYPFPDMVNTPHPIPEHKRSYDLRNVAGLPAAPRGRPNGASRARLVANPVIHSRSERRD